MGTTQSCPGKSLHLYCSIRIRSSELCSCRVVIREVEGSDPAIFKVVECVEQHTCSHETRKRGRATAGDIMRKAICRVKRTMEQKKQAGGERNGEASGGEYDSNSSGNDEAGVGSAGERKRKRKRVIRERGDNDDEEETSDEEEHSRKEVNKRSSDAVRALYPPAADVAYEISRLLAPVRSSGLVSNFWLEYSPCQSRRTHAYRCLSRQISSTLPRRSSSVPTPMRSRTISRSIGRAPRPRQSTSCCAAVVDIVALEMLQEECARSA